MKLIRSFKKILLLVFLCSIIFPKTIKPNGKEDMLKLVIETNEGNKVRPYYMIDKDGLMYKDFKGFKPGDKISLQIMSRTHMASNSNSSKKFQLELIVMEGSKEVSRRDLSYRKKSTNVTSPEKKGFYFSHAGYWFEDIKLTKKTKIILKSKIKGQKIYTRVIADKKDKLSKSDTFIKTVDSQKNIVVEYKKNNNKIKSKGWFLVDKNLEQQFMIPSNKLVRVFCRSVINDEPEKNYSVSVHENGQWIGNYMFEELKTENNSKIVTDYKKIKDKNLSKTRSFYLNIPDGKSNYSYYTFSLPKDSNKNDKVLIKIVEYEKSKN